MAKARRIAVLGRRHFGLLVKSWLLLVIIRLILTFSSYHTILRWIHSTDGSEDAEQHPILIVWSIRHAARFVPAASCLTQALAVRLLLARSGHQSSIQIGVASNPTRGIEAHAWVIKDGKVIIGGIEEDISRFNPIVEL